MNNILMFIAIFLMLISFIIPKKLEIFGLVKSHFLSFYNDVDNKKTVDWWGLILIYLLPFISSIILVICTEFDLSLINNELLTVLGIFVGFLLTSLSILISNFSNYKDVNYNNLTLETVNTIGYEIIHSIILIFFIIADYYNNGDMHFLFDIISLYLLITLILVLMMIIKRIFSINRFQVKMNRDGEKR